jgi:hypothetical protein
MQKPAPIGSSVVKFDGTLDGRSFTFCKIKGYTVPKQGKLVRAIVEVMLVK